MQIAILNNGEVGRIGDYRALFPYTVFPANGPTDEWLAANSCKKVSLIKPYDADTETLVQTAPYVEGDWVYKVAVRSKTPEEVTQSLEAKAESTRAKRNALLTQTDWTQLADAPVDKEAWATYRQALRDVTGQETFPNSVTWPTQPE